MAAYQELFVGACPKYLSPISPPYEDHQALAAWAANPPSDASERQVDLFLADVKAQSAVPTMRSFLKLYTSIDAAKLAKFLEDDDGEEEVLQQLMVLKNSSRTYTRASGSLLEGERIVTNNLDFTIDGVCFSCCEMVGI